MAPAAAPTMLEYNQEAQDNQWFSAPTAPTSASSSTASGSGSSVLQDDGTLVMYWYDLHEEKYADPGTLYLFGKVQAPCTSDNEDEEPEWLSCCVKVSKVDRNMYIVPRKTLRLPGGEETDTPVSLVDFEDENCVFSEFKRNMERERLSVDGCIKGSPVTRFCTFDDDNVSRGLHQCLKYKCPPEVSEVPKAARSGNSYCHIVGAETTCIEQLLLRRKIMGPCWLNISGAQPSSSNFSWCKMEFGVTGIKGINVAEEHRNTPSPSLRVMSLSIKTVFNEQKRRNEIVMLATTAVDQVSADAATPDWEKRTDSRVLLRAPEHRALPLDLRDTIRGKELPIDVQPTERALLNCFFARIHRFDPDIIVAHNIMGFDLEILLGRASENKCANWDRLGRLRRRNQPPKVRAGSNGANLAKYVAGRLLCDTYLSAKDLVRQTTYTLKELCKIQLGVGREIVESEDIPKHYSDTQNLLGLAHHTAKDTRLVLMLMTHLQIIPLSKQLTNIAGNLWTRTLRGGKAERNENLLMHEFFRARHDVSGTPTKFLLPDKKGYSDKPGETKGRRVRKKAAYAGGLVLEPKKGFYDNMILLLDFNSLYPSIIREYNICFTTITTPELGEDGEEQLPDIPSDTPKGILPRVIKTLIESRGVVKQELKKAQPGSTNYQQLDIRQMALKLTANSMYGCLGFTFSRFYAKPLAMLITAQGRALLQRAKEITETSLGLEVVYGDTDSIMVNTRSNNYDEALAKGKEVIKKINEGYKSVELDIDGVFSNMLLLKKKKYAAMTISGKDADGKLQYQRKTSGLDMVRRDWCPLSKEASGYVLDRLLGGRSREDSVEAIHTYLRGLGEKIHDQAWEGFVITKQLTKMPHEYSDAKSQPHVQVAIKMIQRNEQVQAGQSIQYIVVEGNTSSIADRALTPKQFSADKDAKIDYQWYLSTQVHPPISRLCEVIEGTDAARIADCLGEHKLRFVSRSSLLCCCRLLTPG
jgi:DNA polymerase alpha subunit A